jgi:AcrR family transcriptional regulator
MGVKERKERQKQALRERILAVARELFSRDGYDAVSMRKIADRLEYSPTAIYLHFEDKEALMRELCDRDFLALAKEFESLARVADPIERLRRIGLAYVEFGLRLPNHYRLLFMTPRPLHRPDESALQRGNPNEDAYALLQMTVREAMAQKRVRPDQRDPELISQVLWAAVHGVVALHITRGLDPWIEWCPAQKTAQLTVDLLLESLCAQPAARAGKDRKKQRRG